MSRAHALLLVLLAVSAFGAGFWAAHKLLHFQITLVRCTLASPPISL